MKKGTLALRLGMCLILVLTILASMLACAKPAPTTTPPPPTKTTTPPPTTTAPPPAKPIELTFNDHNPAVTGPAKAYDYWAEQVMKDSGGKLKITVIHGGALFTGDEVYRAVKTGLCDGGHYVVDREDGFLLNLIMTLPFMGWPEQHVEAKYQALLDKFPEMRKEWEGVTIMSFMMMPPTHLHFKAENKVVKTPADIKGMKIFCAEATLANIVKAVGGTAVEAGIMDMTPDVQTGLVQGVLNHFPVLLTFGTLELTKSHTVFGGGGINMTPMFDIMNTDILNSLPADLRDLLLHSGHYWFDKFNELDAADQANAKKFCEDNNHTMTYLTPEQIKVWYDKVKKPVHDKWIAECEAAGLPGQALYDEALRLAAEK